MTNDDINVNSGRLQIARLALQSLTDPLQHRELDLYRSRLEEMLRNRSPCREIGAFEQLIAEFNREVGL